MMATGLSTWWTAMPFILKDLGGTVVHVGLAPALNMAAYGAFLLMVYRLHHLDSKYVTRASVWMMVVSCIVVWICIRFMTQTRRLDPLTGLWIIISAGILAGGAMAFFWPYLMTWVSSHYQQEALNRRLGYFNRGWSGAVIVGPVIGAVLVDIDILLPIYAVMIVWLLCVALLNLADGASSIQTTPDQADQQMDDLSDPNKTTTLCRMARIGLFCSWSAMAVARSQFALVFRDLHGSESLFGLLVMASALTNFLVLTGAGHFSFWHGRARFLLVAQGIGALSMGFLIFGRGLIPFFSSFLLQGVSIGISYSSHLYYSAAGRARRSATIALHELTIAASTMIASFAGGLLCRYGGLYWPYWFCIGLFVVGLLIQIIYILELHRQRRPFTPAKQRRDLT
jgi:MFS family permease